MKSCRSDIDWSKKPWPWCEIGPRIRREVAAIFKGMPPDQPPFKVPWW